MTTSVAAGSGNETRKLPIAERLKKKISVDFKREFLSKAIALVSEETGVPIFD